MARNLCLSICVIVILSVLYGGPLLSVKENKRKKNKQFHFSECVKHIANYSASYQGTTTLLEVKVWDFTKTEIFHKSLLRNWELLPWF